MYLNDLYLPSGQNRQKNNLKECAFVDLALKIQCHIVKNTLFSDFADWVPFFLMFRGYTKCF